MAARTPLRVKLVAALLLLVVAALLASGVVARATMHNYLLGRVDSQLEQTQHPFVEHGIGGVVEGTSPGRDRGGSDDGHDAVDSNPDRLPSAYVVAVTDAAGHVVYGPTSALADRAQPLPALPHLTGADLLRSHTLTVHDVAGTAEWRVLATPVTLTDGSTGMLLVAQSLNDVENTVNRLTLLLLVIGAGAVVVLAGLGYALVRTSLRPLREVERTAAQIAAGDLSHRVPDADPHTEVGQLSGALNRMLHEVEAAFDERAASEEAARRSEERMRRFIADASHELRTPLTSIRGFAELYRHGAATGAADIARLMQHIEDEAKRMGLLVEDLLLLARLDQQRPFEQLPVDLLAVANDAVHTAHALAPGRPVKLDVGATTPPPIVIGDEARLRQVLGNLVSNALRHTPEATPVTVGVSTRRSARTGRTVATLTVADEGPGMSAEDAARVFERFFRGDPSRNRNNGGTGLGMAIAAAIVAGHGGTLDLETEPGQGSTFRVELPADS
jgi:two-component system OmpR family sensor kinase